MYTYREAHETTEMTTKPMTREGEEGSDDQNSYDSKEQVSMHLSHEHQSHHVNAQPVVRD